MIHTRALRSGGAVLMVIVATMLLVVACSDDEPTIIGPDCSAATGLEQVTELPGEYPTLSSQGSFMMFVSRTDDLHAIVKMSLCDDSIDTLSTLVGGRYDLDWSWENDLILFRADSVGSDQEELWTMDPVSGEVTAIPTEDMDDGPVWSPNGNEIAYQCSGGGVCVISYPDGNAESVTCTEPGGGGDCQGEDPDWSPDGEWIAYGGGSIMKVRRTGGEAEEVVADMGLVYSPVWSPDGNWIAFEREDPAAPNNYHIWVTDARGSSFGVVQITTADPRCAPGDMCYDGDVCWSPDSKTLYFTRSGESFESEIWRITFDGIN